MTNFTSHPDALFDPNKPILGSVALQSRDNLAATTEGSSGAPRIQDASLSTSVTSAGANWVGRRIAAIGAAGVGIYVLLYNASGATFSIGSVTAGSNLRYSNASGSIGAQAAPPGTWRCQGISSPASSSPIDKSVSVWVRIA